MLAFYPIGLLGGPGLASSLSSMEQNLMIPGWLSWIGWIGAGAASLGLIVGYQTRIAAFGAACICSLIAAQEIRAEMAGPPSMEIGAMPVLVLVCIGILLLGPGDAAIDSGRRKSSKKRG